MPLLIVDFGDMMIYIDYQNFKIPSPAPHSGESIITICHNTANTKNTTTVHYADEDRKTMFQTTGTLLLYL